MPIDPTLDTRRAVEERRVHDLVRVHVRDNAMVLVADSARAIA